MGFRRFLQERLGAPIATVDIAPVPRGSFSISPGKLHVKPIAVSPGKLHVKPIAVVPSSYHRQRGVIIRTEAFVDTQSLARNAFESSSEPTASVDHDSRMASGSSLAVAALSFIDFGCPNSRLATLKVATTQLPTPLTPFCGKCGVWIVEEFQDQADVYRLDQLVKTANTKRVPPISEPSVVTERFDLKVPDIHEVKYEPFLAQARTFPLTSFMIRVTNLSFPKPQTEPKKVRRNRPSHTPIFTHIKFPKTPEKARSFSLEERLRWILMPPFHELLPQLVLPEYPTPFQYQWFGIKWLYEREHAVLADEMGLGKTMQAILTARLLWRQGLISSILVVCPKALVTNWKRECTHWWPEMADRIMLVDSDRQWFLKLGSRYATIKIINYEAIQRELDWLKEQSVVHDLVILDEAQRIKTPSSKTSQAVKALKADRRWAVTGTPIENRVEDVISIFGFVRPGLITSDGERHVREKIKPYLLRRTIEIDEVRKELPDKFEQDVEIELGPEQRRQYDALERQGVVELESQGERITVQHVFALIRKLSQVCNFDLDTGESAKFERLTEDCEEVLESGRKILVFSQFVHEKYGLKRLAAEFRKAGFKPLELHGQVRPEERTAVVDQFSTTKLHNVLLLNYSVGGVGLNLQMASHVFLFDRWWNPAVEDQAGGRAYRLGQKENVVIHKFVCRDTIEERIVLKLKEKKRIFKAVIDDSEPTETLGLSEEEIFSLFNLKVRPRRK